MAKQKQQRPYYMLGCCCSVAQLCSTLCNAMDCSTPGFPVLHHLPVFAQTHVRWTIPPFHPLSSPSPLAFNLFPATASFPITIIKIYLPFLFLSALMATALTAVPVRVIPKPIQNSPAPSACPVLQLSSDNSVVVSSPGDGVRSHGLTALPYKTAPPSFRPKLAALLSGYSLGVPSTPSLD